MAASAAWIRLQVGSPGCSLARLGCQCVTVASARASAAHAPLAIGTPMRTTRENVATTRPPPAGRRGCKPDVTHGMRGANPITVRAAASAGPPLRSV